MGTEAQWEAANRGMFVENSLVPLLAPIRDKYRGRRGAALRIACIGDILQ